MERAVRISLVPAAGTSATAERNTLVVVKPSDAQVQNTPPGAAKVKEMIRKLEQDNAVNEATHSLQCFVRDDASAMINITPGGIQSGMRDLAVGKDGKEIFFESVTGNRVTLEYEVEAIVGATVTAPTRAATGDKVSRLRISADFNESKSPQPSNSVHVRQKAEKAKKLVKKMNEVTSKYCGQAGRAAAEALDVPRGSYGLERPHESNRQVKTLFWEPGFFQALHEVCRYAERLGITFVEADLASAIRKRLGNQCSEVRRKTIKKEAMKNRHREAEAWAATYEKYWRANAYPVEWKSAIGASLADSKVRGKRVHCRLPTAFRTNARRQVTLPARMTELCCSTACMGTCSDGSSLTDANTRQISILQWEAISAEELESASLLTYDQMLEMSTCEKGLEVVGSGEGTSDEESEVSETEEEDEVAAMMQVAAQQVESQRQEQAERKAARQMGAAGAQRGSKRPAGGTRGGQGRGGRKRGRGRA